MFTFMIPGSVGDYYYYDNDDEKDTLLCLDVERDYYSFSFVALTVDQKRDYESLVDTSGFRYFEVERKENLWEHLILAGA